MKRGFTLIELLVVVLIIGILSAIALPQYQKAVMKSRYVQLITAVKSLMTAQETYYLANTTYGELENLDVSIPESTKYTIDYVDQTAIVAHLTDYPLAYVHYFPHGTNYTAGRRCRVDGSDQAVYHELCKSLTGNTQGLEIDTNITDYLFLY